MAFFRFLGILLIIVSLMLLGADVVSALEHSDAMIPRSLNQILVLFGFDAMEWLAQNLPVQFAQACITVVSWPGWAVMGIPGVVFGLLAASRTDRRPPKPLPPIDRSFASQP